MNNIEKIKYVIEAIVNIPLFIKLKYKRNKVVLILSPQYLNYGDHLIAKAEIDYLKRLTGKKPVDINLSFYQLWPQTVFNSIKKDDVVIVTGGGYIGDLWPDSHKTVVDVINRFSDNTIIFAPQTTYFNDLKSDAVKSFSDIVKEQGLCYFFSRESNTENLLKEIGIQSITVPDFALLFQLTTKPKDRCKYISFCLRNDCESILSSGTYDRLKNQLSCFGLPFHNIIMAKEHCEIPTWFRDVFIRDKINEYSKSKLVITDRLHSMIFCAIVGVPCVAMDNSSHKISGVYKWIKDLNYIALANSENEILFFAEEVMKFSEHQKNRAQFKKSQKEFYQIMNKRFDMYLK